MNVQKTKNYEMFKTHKQNRPVRSKHVDEMVRDPDFPKNIDSFPILVTKDFDIMDGGHRLEACKQLGIPVPYISSENISTDTMRLINSRSKNWTTCDYLKFYVDGGYAPYKTFEMHKKKYSISHGYLSIFWAYFQFPSPVTWHKNFKVGKLTLAKLDKIEEALEDICGHIKILRETTDSIMVRKILMQIFYISAFIELFDLERPKYERIMKRLPMYYTHLPVPRSKDEALRMLSNMASKRRVLIHEE